MAHTKKDSDNTSINEIDPVSSPATKSIVDRYILASHWCKDKKVLDAACGYGFGSEILHSLGANKVKGYDLDEDAINYAEKNYSSKQLSFKVQNLSNSEDNFTGNLVDTIVSIETFEHLPREEVNQMLKNFKFMCKKSGTILITTPVRRTKEFEYKGGTHLWEYNYKEFMTELTKVWNADNITLHGLSETWADEDNFVTIFDKEFKMKRSALFFAEITND